ncbi:uncharacterized protein [Miscanthus floridulus]|uniref:uncharacterized protein n=1 Tax=Miscanthus floridulus TaxID=154761 RepID=UPI0034580EED
MLLKVDLAKAFDTVAWPFLLEVLDHIGFPLRWRDWISTMLGTVSTKVLVNGRPGRRICHARGLRQGDPLSPFLFVIVMEVLNALIAEADRRALLTTLPGNAIKYRASIYADDLGLQGSPVATNLDKCSITPDDVEAMLHARLIPLQTPGVSYQYLGVPLSLSWLSRANEQALVDAVAARIPTWKRMEGLIHRGLLRARTSAKEWLLPNDEGLLSLPDGYVVSFTHFHEHGFTTPADIFL